MAIATINGGAFQDSEGNILANGILFLKLNHDAYTDDTFTTLICAGEEIAIQLDSDGNIEGSVFAWPNDTIFDVWTLSAVTFYMARVETADGQLAWGPNALYILSTPSPFSFTTDVVPINPA